MKIYRVEFLYSKYYYEGRCIDKGRESTIDLHVEADGVRNATSIIEVCYPDCTVTSCSFVCVLSTPMDSLPQYMKKEI